MKLLNTTSSLVSDLFVSKNQWHCLTSFYFFLCTVVGGEEESTQSVNVRNRDDVGTKAKGKTIPLDDVLASAIRLKESKSLENKF